MTVRWRFAWAGFELGSPDYQEKVLSTTLVRDHQFIVIWVDLFVAVRHNINILKHIYTWIYIYLYIYGIYMLLFQIENRSPGDILNLFIACSLCKWKFVHCQFVYEDTNEGCLFANGPNGINWLAQLLVPARASRLTCYLWSSRIRHWRRVVETSSLSR